MKVAKVAIVGFGVEGRASYAYFTKQGADITICDQNIHLADIPEGAKTRLGPDYLEGLDAYDIVMRTPPIRADILTEKNPRIADKISGNINEFFRVRPTQHIIGVTGTKGKGTTSTLIAKMLEASGKHVFLGGNIGIPALSFIDDVQPDDWVVLELSSFQLSDLRYSPHIAVCVLVVPEHLDWHGDFADYTNAKANLFRQQTQEDIAIFYAKSDAARAIAQTGNATPIPYYQSPGACVIDGSVVIDGQEICRTDELKLLGEHNWQNVCAAVTAVWQVTQDVHALRSVLTTFGGLPHRIEFVRELAGVRYYNDSYASGLHATEAAIKAVPGPTISIIGGHDRMLPLEHFAEFAARANSVKQFMVIGACGDRLAQALDHAGVTNYTRSTATTMPQIIADAQKLASPGDAILLSPGFASFDMFKNFEIRGNEFRNLVQAL